MCIIEFTRQVTLHVIHQVGDDTSEPISEYETFEAGEEVDVDIYDTDGEEACIQFPQGDIVIGIPIARFRVVKPCDTCDDPQDPDLDREGPLGAMPRWPLKRMQLRLGRLRMEMERARS